LAEGKNRGKKKKKTLEKKKSPKGNVRAGEKKGEELQTDCAIKYPTTGDERTRKEKVLELKTTHPDPVGKDAEENAEKVKTKRKSHNLNLGGEKKIAKGNYQIPSQN